MCFPHFIILIQGDPQSISVKRIKLHPRWSPNPLRGYPNDIALLELSSPADLSGSFATAIPMVTKGEDGSDNTDCWITGWGKTSSSSGIPNVLQVGCYGICMMPL